MTRYKVYILILTACTLIFGCITIYHFYDRYRIGDIKEREILLEAVMWEITKNNSISQEEVDEIKVLRSDAGVYPYFYGVVINMKNGEQISYTWSDKSKTGVVRDGVDWIEKWIFIDSSNHY